MIGFGLPYLGLLEDGCEEYGQMRREQSMLKKSRYLLTKSTSIDYSIDFTPRFTFIMGQNLHGGTVQPRNQWELVPSVAPKPYRAILSAIVVVE